jgi:hypothetical protein
MKVKTVEVNGKQYAEVVDGKVLGVHPDGNETPFDLPDMYAKLLRDGKTVSEYRKKTEEYEGKLKSYEGIEPDAARAALELAANIKDGDLVKAGKVEEIKAAAKKAAEEQVAAANKQYAVDLAAEKAERERLDNLLKSEKIGGFFARSTFIKEKVAIPPDFLQAKYQGNFQVERDGKLVVKGADGNPIYSRARPGEIATPEEAIEVLISGDPNRDHILKGSNSSGSGSRGGGGGSGSGGRTLARSEYDRMPPDQKAALMRDPKTRPELVDG